jgi:long-chain acyl-CoA synthetase
MKDKIHPVLQVKYLDEEDIKKFKEKAIPVVPAQNEQETPIFRSAGSPNEIVKDFPNMKTVQEIFENSVKNFGNNPFLGTRYPSLVKGQLVWSDYQYKTYKQVDHDRIKFGSGLMNLYDQFVAQKQDLWFLGIFSINRYEWLVAELGAGAHSIPNVALYDTLGPETSEFILNHAEVPILVTSVDKVATVLELSPKCPLLKVIIVMESLLKEQADPIPILKKWGSQLGIAVVTFNEVLELGKKKPIPKKLPAGDDLLCLSYTSGTTGNPKGAMLSHTNLVSTLRAAAFTVLLGQDDVHISYLPLAHIFERVMITNIMMIGASAGFFRGDVTLLVEDIGVLKPTFFASVPRLLNRIYDKIIQGALHSGSSLKATLFTKALESKLYYLEKDGCLTHSVWDPLVFKKVKLVLGGRLRMIFTASAPISSQVLSFLRVACGCQVLEAYGQTESCGGLTVTLPGDYSTGNVGAVIPK